MLKLAARRSAQPFHHIAPILLPVVDFEIIVVIAVIDQSAAVNITSQISGEHGRGAHIQQQALGGDAFGKDDLMFVKQQLEIIHEPAIDPGHGCAVDQMLGLDQNLAAAGADFINALIDEQPVIRADHQIVQIVQG